MRKSLIVAGAALLALSSQAEAASGVIEYRCRSVAARAHIEAAYEQGHSALFFYRLREALDAGECSLAKPVRPYVSSAPSLASRARVRTAQREGFPPPWLFKPVR